MSYEEASTPVGVSEVELGDGILPGDRSPLVLFGLFRECPEDRKASGLSAGELTARNWFINNGFKKLAVELFSKPDPERWKERQQLQRSSLSNAESGAYTLFLNSAMMKIAVRLYHTPPSQRSRDEYLRAYGSYIRMREHLGPARMQAKIWDRLDRLPHWKFFADWRNQQRKLRSAKRLEWLAVVHPSLPSQKAATARYNDSEAARHAKRVYAQSEKGKAARAKREAARAKREADLLATPDDEVIRPEMLQ